MKKKTKKLDYRRYVYFGAALLTLSGLCYLVTPSPSPASSVVSIMNRTGTGGGTGFSTRNLAGEHVIVTNDHVCEVGMGGYVVVIDDVGQGHMKRILTRNFTRDLCVVEGIDVPTLPVSTRPAKRFDELQVVGHPLLGPTTPSKGAYLEDAIVPIGFNTRPDGTCPDAAQIIESFFGSFCVAHMELSLTSISIFPGNSGSPVLNRDGEVVGVINSGDNRTTYGNFVPLKYLREILGEKQN